MTPFAATLFYCFFSFLSSSCFWDSSAPLIIAAMKSFGLTFFYSTFFGTGAAFGFLDYSLPC
jgi:hypothetical protein